MCLCESWRTYGRAGVSSASPSPLAILLSSYSVRRSNPDSFDLPDLLKLLSFSSVKETLMVVRTGSAEGVWGNPFVLLGLLVCVCVCV